MVNKSTKENTTPENRETIEEILCFDLDTHPLDEYDLYEFGTRIKLQKKGSECASDTVISKRLIDVEYTTVKPFLKGVHKARQDYAQMSFGDLHFMITVEPQTDNLGKLGVWIETSNMTDGDKKLLKEAIGRRSLRIITGND